MSDEDVARWDEWFKMTGDSNSIKTWQAVKTTLPRYQWTTWAQIVELNRLDALEKKVAVRQQY